MKKKHLGSKRVERLKSLLIVLLSCSAIYLTIEIEWPGTFPGLFPAPPVSEPSSPQTTQEERAAAAHPMRILATVEGGRYGIQYDQEACDTLFQQVYSLLVEAVSSASVPVPITQAQWQQALTHTPGLWLDWGGSLPMEVLQGWLSADNPNLTGTVGQMALVEQEEQVILYFFDETQGSYFACQVQMVKAGRIEEATHSLKPNGASFAFELEEFQMLAPQTMIFSRPPQPWVYTASNPLEHSDGMEHLHKTLHIPADSPYYYNALGEQVIRHENDTLRISSHGIVTYEADENSDRFLLPDNGLFSAVEGSRQVLQGLMDGLSTQAQLYLLSAQPTEQGGWLVEFGYGLNGVPVRMTDGIPAARFLVEQGRISRFRISCRSYVQSGSTSVVLPQKQAAAAMEAMGHSHEELELIYLDSGEEQMAASWAATSVLGQEGAE